MGGIGKRPIGNLSNPQPLQNVPQWGGAEVRGFATATLADELTGRTLALRPLTADDYDEWSALRLRNGDALADLEPDWPADLPDPAESPQYFQAMIELSDSERAGGREYDYGIWHDGELIGEAGLYGVIRSSIQSAQLRLWIDSDHVGHGHAGEAYFLLCRLAFSTLDLHRVEAAVEPDNSAVKRALEKFGVRTEGLARGYMRVAGEWRDHERYGITAEEFDARADELASQHMG